MCRPIEKLELQPKILAAMRDDVDTVQCEVLKVVDKSNQPTSLILMNVLREGEVPEDYAEEEEF